MISTHAVPADRKDTFAFPSKIKNSIKKGYNGNKTVTNLLQNTPVKLNVLVIFYYERSNAMEMLKIKNCSGKAIVIFLLITFASVVFSAQNKPASVILQEGLYAEEIEGNLDEAIKIYQQIIKDSQQMEQAAAQATYRIGLCYLKKSDTENAAKQFKELISKYPKQISLVKEAQKQIEILASSQLKSLTVPVVVSTKPQNYSDNVSPDTNEISVTFDRKMMDRSWSWVKWNYPFPEGSGTTSYDKTKTTCTLSVKMEPGKAYLVRINSDEYSNFKSTDGTKAQPFVLVFATKDKNGKPTPIPAEMLNFAKQVNSEITAVSQRPFVYQYYGEITPDGVIKFKETETFENKDNSTLTNYSFTTVKHIQITAMYDDKGKPLQFTVNPKQFTAAPKMDGLFLDYNVALNEPVKPGEKYSYSMEGSITDAVKKVENMGNTFQVQTTMNQGLDGLMTTTYLLPKGPEVISKSPAEMKQTEKNGQIELYNEKPIGKGTSISTQFQYKLSGAKIDISKEQPEKIIKEAVMTISTCAESDPRVAASLNTLKGLDQKTAVKEISNYLDNETANVRRSAIYILWKGDFASIELAQEKLLKLCSHEENLTRGMAALAIGGKKVTAGFETLKNMALNDKDGYVRRCAAYALGLYGNTEALPTLKKALEDADSMVKANAEAAIKLLTKSSDKNS
jgi:hypothetical protein